jgi:hypothetical protein
MGFHYTEGMDMDSHNFVYVADEGGCVRKFDPIGSMLSKWGGKGNNDGEFQTAYALATDSSNNVVVTDVGRIQKFDHEGTFLTKWGASGQANSEFASPFGIEIDKFGNIFVCEEGNHRVQKFDSSGKFLTTWGSKGDADGQLKIPRDSVVDSNGVVYVSDGSNHRVQVFVPKNSNAILFLKDLQTKRKYLEEINQLKFYVDKILSENRNAGEAAWKGIELLARRKVISTEVGIWDSISKEILQTEPGFFASEALDLLKTILYTSKALQRSNNEASSKAKELYQGKLIEILESVNVIWRHQKLFTKQILDEVATENERLSIYWKAWRKNATDNPDDAAFLKYTGYFIRDLENSSSQFKRSIETEIFDLIQSSSTSISNRAKDMHWLLFSQ